MGTWPKERFARALSANYDHFTFNAESPQGARGTAGCPLSSVHFHPLFLSSLICLSCTWTIVSFICWISSPPLSSALGLCFWSGHCISVLCHTHTCTHTHTHMHSIQAMQWFFFLQLLIYRAIYLYFFFFFLNKQVYWLQSAHKLDSVFIKKGSKKRGVTVYSFCHVSINSIWIKTIITQNENHKETDWAPGRSPVFLTTSNRIQCRHFFSNRQSYRAMHFCPVHWKVKTRIE